MTSRLNGYFEMDLQSELRFFRVTDQLSCELNGEIAILNLKSKLYFGLTDVSAFIWHMLESPTNLKAIVSAVVQEFDTEEACCTSDIASFLQDLDRASLLQIDRDEISPK